MTVEQCQYLKDGIVRRQDFVLSHCQSDHGQRRHRDCRDKIGRPQIIAVR